MPQNRQEGRQDSTASSARSRTDRGVSLLEVIVAMLVLSVGVLAVLKTFGNIAKSLQHSRYRTMAATLAQEKINVLKQQPYYRISPSTSTANVPNVNPPVIYDNTQFGREELAAGGVAYTRYTYVDRVMTDAGGNLMHVSPSDADTGLKRIIVSIVWQQDGEFLSYQVNNVFSNPLTVMRRAIFKGVITDTLGFGINGAVVKIAENPVWNAITDLNGSYQFVVSAGSYTVVATRPGYQIRSTATWVTDNATKIVNFTLPLQPSGTMMGAAWTNPAPVISQVVTSTTPGTGDFEYIEIFNASTATWNMGATGSPQFKVRYRDGTGADLDIASDPSFIIVSTYLPPNHYYLITNDPSPTFRGTSVQTFADAYYTGDIIRDESNGSVAFTAPSGRVDTVGWRRSSPHTSSDMYEGSGPVSVTGSGLPAGAQLVRHTSTDTALSPMGTPNVGNAYDTNNNVKDWVADIAGPLSRMPHNLASGPADVVAGVPAVGAIVVASDGMSVSTRAYAVNDGVGQLNYAAFRVINVATGTWSVVVTSGGAMGQINEVSVVYNATSHIPNRGAALTSPEWIPANGPAGVVTSTLPTHGFISGRVLDKGLLPIPSPIQVKAGFNTVTIEPDGSYSLAIDLTTLDHAPPAILDVTFNPENGDANFVTESASNIHVYPGQITTGVDCLLAKTSRIRAFVSSDGTIGLGNIALSVFDNAGTEISQAVSDDTGFAAISNLPLGNQYTVRPVIGSKEVSDPQEYTFTPLSVGSVMIGTFTIQGSTGKISGTVREDGSPIQIGTLVVASTFSSTNPPALSNATITSYFIATTDERGFYTMDVVGSTQPYYVRAFYTPRGAAPKHKQSATLPIVPPGGSISSVDISW